MVISPIKNDADHETALSEIERLWGVPAGTPDGDRLDVLLVLAENYEKPRFSLAPPDPIAAIRFRIEQLGLDSRALIGVIGTKTQVAEVLRGDRALSLPMIRRLHEKLGIPAETLIRPIAEKKRRRAA